MPCLYCNFDGTCQLFDEEWDYSFDKDGLCIDGYGFDIKGYCYCEDDPDPSYSCGNYEEQR